MALIFNIADVQRRIWRQLAGTRIKSLYSMSKELINNLTLNDKEIFNEYLVYKHKDNLVAELTRSLESIEKENFTPRVKVDLIFIKLLIKEKVSYLILLIQFYTEFREELIRLTSSLK